MVWVTKVKDFVVEEESVSILELIHTDFPTRIQDEVCFHAEKIQHP